jgi:hypothetical protein
MLDALFTLKNARKRLTNLKQTIEGGGSFDIDTATAYFHPTYPGIIRSDVPNPLHYISPEVGAIAAELRAVLDQMLYALLLKRLAKVPENRPRFPICKKPEDFRSRKPVDLKGLFEEDLAFIEELQPYKGFDWLLRLKKLADSHKHTGNVFLRATDGVVIHAQADTEGFLVLPVSGVRVPKSMQVKAVFRGKITLEDGTPVVDLLEIFQAEVASMLDRFKTRFSLS